MSTEFDYFQLQKARINQLSNPFTFWLFSQLCLRDKSLGRLKWRMKALLYTVCRHRAGTVKKKKKKRENTTSDQDFLNGQMKE